ncbi:hypothetical protein ACFS4T_12700 [Pseudomonas lini]
MARDEYRANFALNSVSPDHLEISLPGVHSDIGGGYREDIEECVLLSPMQALEVGEFTDVKKPPRSTERHNRNGRNGTPRAGQWRCWN